MAQKMDRGTDAMRVHLTSCQELDIRQSRRGWCQELMLCEAKTEFKYFNAEQTQIAQSLEESGCCCRIFCAGIHPFTMTVKEMGTDAELLTVERPCACAAGACKCCCYQSATFTSGGQTLGSIQEQCYYCVPSFVVTDGATNQPIYKVHPPTCCGGVCYNPCSEGNPCCGKGCCKVPFRVYDAAQSDTNGDAPYLGKILKKPKSMATEVFTDANAFQVTFPEQATVEQKAMLVGTSIFLNAVFFEGQQN